MPPPHKPSLRVLVGRRLLDRFSHRGRLFCLGLSRCLSRRRLRHERLGTVGNPKRVLYETTRPALVFHQLKLTITTAETSEQW